MVKSEKWLIHMPNNPGDVVMSLYVVDAWKDARPQDELYFLVDAECEGLVKNHPQLKGYFLTPRKALQGLDSTSSLTVFDTYLAPLQAIKWDGILNLFQGIEGALFLHQIQSPKRLGLECNPMGEAIILDEWTRYLFAIPAERRANTLHVIDIYLRIANLNPTHRPRAQFPSYTLGLNIPQQAIGLQIGSAWEGKKWPLKHWTSLIQGILARRPKQQFVLLGAPQEIDENKQIVNQFPQNIVSLVGQSKLHELPQILPRLTLLITGDTFAMHVATAVQTPVIALFGPSNPIETGPYATGALVQYVQIPQDANLAFNDPSLLQQISPAKILDLLAGKTDLQTLEGCWSNSRHGWLNLPAFSINHHIPQSALTLLEFLHQALKDPQAYFAQVENGEQILASETQDQLCWEMYRIALRALDWRSPLQFLQQRLKLLQSHLHSFSSQP